MVESKRKKNKKKRSKMHILIILESIALAFVTFLIGVLVGYTL